MDRSTLKPATELARTSAVRHPNESAEYRRAREALLAEEIELRRHIERVAELRRSLPPGGEVTKTYSFDGENGKAGLADLFGDKPTLIIYSYMFGPQREKPCPMCTSFMGTWETKLQDIERRVSIVFVARSPIARLIAAKKARGWTQHKIYSDVLGDYTRDYVSKDDADMPGYSVFARRDGAIRHFWSAEMGRAPPIPDRIRAVRRISIRSGPSSTRRPKAAAGTGIRASTIDARNAVKSRSTARRHSVKVRCTSRLPRNTTGNLCRNETTFQAIFRCLTSART
jgi:predicted dithiol-disulfide oxidoreductase (DUF899 family)